MGEEMYWRETYTMISEEILDLFFFTFPPFAVSRLDAFQTLTL